MMYSVPNENHQERKVSQAFIDINLVSQDGPDLPRKCTLTEELRGTVYGFKINPQEN